MILTLHMSIKKM